MFLSHESPKQGCFSATELCPANADRDSATNREFSDQACFSTVETADSESYQTFVSDRELRLQAFIQKAHQMSRSGNYPPDLALQLLDRAWEAQNMLWELRQSQTTTPLQEDWVCKSWVYRPNQGR